MNINDTHPALACTCADSNNCEIHSDGSLCICPAGQINWECAAH